MKNILLFIAFFSLLHAPAQAQIIYGAYAEDSLVINFATNNTYAAYITPDAGSPQVWQWGNTSKSFNPTDSVSLKGMMTDTTLPDARLANNYFVLTISSLSKNQIVTVWHSYTTDSTHAGGTIEYSLDFGTTWQNMLGFCNIDDSPGYKTGIRTENFYAAKDTLFNGTPAFTGTSYGAGYSRFQFYMGSETDSICSYTIGNEVLVRFRFMSDTAIDTKAGWLIDSISVRHDYYNAGIKNVAVAQLQVYPNPSTGIFVFPALNDEAHATTEVYNAIGMCVQRLPYTHSMDLSAFPPGLYIYKVIHEDGVYTGQLVRE